MKLELEKKVFPLAKPGGKESKVNEEAATLEHEADPPI